MNGRAFYMALAAFFWIAIESKVYAQTTTSDFEITLSACAENKNIPLASDLLGKISSIYGDQSTRSTLNDIGAFLSLIPTGDRSAAYGLYQACIADILPRLQSPQQSIAVGRGNAPQLPTVEFKVCSGEYERACQPHDVYLYCYADVSAWASAHCTAFTVSRYNIYGGNKCGYAMDLVSCTGPK
jgi:hypothetical protein